MALCVGIILFGTLIYTHVVSKFELIFAEMEIELPRLTLAVVGLSGLLRDTYYLPVLALIAVVVAKEFVIENAGIKGPVNIALLISLIVFTIVSIAALFLPLMLLASKIGAE